MTALTVSEVAEVLRISARRAYALIRRGDLPAFKLGRQVRVDRQELEAFVRTGGKALPGGWRYRR